MCPIFKSVLFLVSRIHHGSPYRDRDRGYPRDPSETQGSPHNNNKHFISFRLIPGIIKFLIEIANCNRFDNF